MAAWAAAVQSRAGAGWRSKWHIQIWNTSSLVNTAPDGHFLGCATARLPRNGAEYRVLIYERVSGASG